MNKGLFITGTGTDVGKTYLSALFVKQLKKRGEAVGYFKPVLSGAEKKDGALLAGDCAYVYQEAHLDGDPNESAAYLFQHAVSPHLAAKMEGKAVSLEVIQTKFQQLRYIHSHLIVEGAGGAICPLRAEPSYLFLTDVMQQIGFGLVIVSQSGLGAINEVLLTLFYLREKKLDVRGIVLNCYDENSFLHQDNKKTIEALANLPVFVCKKGAQELSFDSSLLGV